MKYVCEKCGSSDVEEKQWVKINTGKSAGLVDDGEVVWCCQCEQETSLKEEAEAKEK